MTDPAIPGLTRHYVTIGERQVHYRRMGNGPALIMIHRLPRSSADLVPFITEAAQYFTVIAPDLAGYGNSWQLFLPSDGGGPKPATIINYVDDIDEVLKELEIKRAFVYGEHFGAMVALQLAIRDPKRIAGTVLNGLSITMTEADKTEARNAYPSFEPKWDGSHLAWLWAFQREENLFYPWWSKSLANRLEEDMPPPEKIHSRVLQFLAEGRNPYDNARHMTAGRRRTFTAGRLGNGYRLGYLAGMDFKPIPHFVNLTIPTLITGTPLFQKDVTLARTAQKSAHVEVKQAESLSAARAAALTFISAHASKVPSPPAAPPTKPIPGGIWSSFIPVTGGQLHAYMNDDVPTVPLLVQHDAAASVASVEPVVRSFVGRRTVLAFDLPGSGESDNVLGSDNIDVGSYADVMRSVLDTFGLTQVDYYGMRGGGLIGLELALRDKSRLRRLVMSNVYQHVSEEQRFAEAMPEVKPLWHGGHLLECWHQMRDLGLYYPWFDKTRGAVIKREPQLDVNMIHSRVCALLKAGNNYRVAYQACLRYPTHEKLAQNSVPTILGTTKWDPNNPHTEAAAKAGSKAKLRYFDEDFAKWGESFLDVLEDADRMG